MSLSETKYQRELIKRIEQNYLPGSKVLTNDPRELQGIPDIIILYNNRWAMLEVKVSDNAPVQPNQQYYIDKFNEMGTAYFINPTNEDEVMDAIQRALKN